MKIFSYVTFLCGLYHPRARLRAVALSQPSLVPAQHAAPLVAQLLQRAVSSASDRPCTTPDAWLYRDLFNGTCD